jgi:hypothetical protein
MAKTVRTTPQQLEIKSDSEGYFLFHEDKPLLTPGGHRVSAASSALLEHMVRELIELGIEEIVLSHGALRKPLVLSAYTLYSTQRDFIEAGIGPSIAEFRVRAGRDPLLEACSTGDRCQSPAFEKAGEYLNSLGLQLKPFDGKEFNEYLNVLMDQWRELEPPQQAVVVNLYSCHGGHVLYPLMLATGNCMDSEYSMQVWAAQTQPSDSAGIDPDQIMEAGQYIEALEGDANVCLNYLSVWEDRG